MAKLRFDFASRIRCRLSIAAGHAVPESAGNCQSRDIHEKMADGHFDHLHNLDVPHTRGSNQHDNDGWPVDVVVFPWNLAEQVDAEIPATNARRI